MVGSGAAGYASVNVKIRAMKAKLLSIADYDRVIPVESLGEGIRTIIGLVAPSKLADALSSLMTSEDTLDLKDIDRILNQSYITIHIKLAEMCPDATKNFLELYAQKYDIDNLKTIIKAIHQDLPPDEIRKLLMPSISRTDEELTELIIAESITQLCEALKDDITKSTILRAMDAYNETGNILPIELALDQMFYTQLWDALSTLSKGDREWASNLLGMRIDLLNILSILRGVQLGFDTSLLNQLVIPITHRLTKRLDEAMELESALEVTRILMVRPYEKIVNLVREILEENRSLAEAEHLIEDYFTRENRRVFMGYPFHIGTVLAFLNLFNAELRNLKSILIGIEEQVPSSRLRESLVFVR